MMTFARGPRHGAGSALPLLDALPDWVIRFDIGLRCVEANRAVALAANVDPAELVGRTADELGAGPPFDAEWRGLLASVRATQCCAQATVLVTRSEQTRLYLVRVVPERDANGGLAHLVASATDITSAVDRGGHAPTRPVDVVLRSADRLARMQQVTSSFSQAKTPLEVAEVLVTEGCQAFQSDAGVVMFVNAQGTHLEVARTLGYPDEAVRQWREVPLDASAPLSDAVRTGSATFFASHDQVTRRYPHLADQRHPVDEALAAIPLTIEGRTLGAIGLVFRRVTTFDADDRAFAVALAAQCAQALDRARLYEAEARARREAEAANRAKDEFLATMSHELRTPLQAIFGWVALLRNKRLDPAAYQRAIESIERGAKSQARLIDDIFDTSRIISGKISLNYAEVDIEPVVQSAVDLVRPAAAAKHITLQLATHGAGVLRGDADRLQQVVSNLVGNAVKFTPDGGRVEVSVERRSSSIVLRVVDTGQGIAPELLPNVFERFWQGDSSTTRRHGGLGLGLAIVRHLVELHRGTVQVESAGIGQGAAFCVEIPIAVPVEPTTARESNSQGAGDVTRDLAGLRVLLVDDDPGGREAAAALLGARGAEVTSAGCAEDALNRLRSQATDVLVCDIGMPDIDGYQLMRELRTLHPERGGRTPAVALTAYASSDDVQRALLAGFDAHVAKPMDPEALVSAIIKVRQRDAAMPSAT